MFCSRFATSSVTKSYFHFSARMTVDLNNSNFLLSRDQLIEKFGWEEYLIFALMLGVSTGNPY